MLIQLCKKINQERTELKLSSIAFLYRYLTFIAISFVFLLDNNMHSTGRKTMIAVCTGVACILLNHLYHMYSNDQRKVLLLLFMETLFNVYILIPSGGLSSPYIWYSLNTIIIAAVSLNRIIYCWVNLSIYLFSSIWAVSVWLNSEDSFIHAVVKQANLLLSLLLITGIIQLLSSYAKKLNEKNIYLQNVNEKVVKANEKIKESVNYIMELYHAVHMLTTQKDEISLNRLLIEYAEKMTNSSTGFLIRNNKVFTRSKTPYEMSEKPLQGKLGEAVRELVNNRAIPVYTYRNNKYILAAIRCNYKLYGVIGVEWTSLQPEEKDIIDQLMFLSNLGTLVLEKIELESVNRGLLINEEQNRIANEIHDGVLQNLFSVSCGINTLLKRSGAISRNNLAAELTLLRSSINSTMSDLRTTIYGYSWKKGGVNNFINDIENYVETIRKFHGASIQFVLRGNHEVLSPNQKKTIYRIISEAAGNSIKHGKAEKIDIGLDVGVSAAVLSLIDNGSGFDLAILEQENKMGLGLRNIHFLAHSLDGHLQLNSEAGKGTSIIICFPLEQKLAVCGEDAI